jgi:hypothetical protein
MVNQLIIDRVPGFQGTQVSHVTGLSVAGVDGDRPKQASRDEGADSCIRRPSAGEKFEEAENQHCGAK